MRRSGLDPRTVVGAVVLAAAILTAVGHGLQAPHALPWLVAHLGRWRALAIAAGLPLTLVYVAAEILRWTVFIPRTLDTRVAYAVLPPADFDPRPEAIEAFGQQLLGVRRRVLAWLDRPACGLRIRLTTTPDGRLLYLVEVPARFRGSLFNAYATAYPTVDVRPLEDVDGGAPAGRGVHSR